MSVKAYSHKYWEDSIVNLHTDTYGSIYDFDELCQKIMGTSKLYKKDRDEIEQYWWNHRPMPLWLAQNLAKHFGFTVKYWITYNRLTNSKELI